MTGPWTPEDMLGGVSAAAADQQEIGQPVEIAHGLIVYGCATLAGRPDMSPRAANDGPRLTPGRPF